MEDKNISTLLQKFDRGDCNENEIEILDTWYLHYGAESNFKTTDEQLEQSTQNIWERLEKDYKKPISYKLWPKIAAAAVVIFTLAIALFYINPSIPTNDQVAISNFPPGSNKAILTLSDGTKVSLNDVKTGSIARQQGVVISKQSNGMLIYEMTGNAAAFTATSINTIETPKGGEYKVVLPDGTHIWLNAASVLKFPASFNNQKERRIELQGEAYFEVARNSNQPFKVMSKGQVVEVTGTHFNINAYPDENFIKTTLVEGAVMVNKQKIFPGQEAVLTATGLEVRATDVENETAWKNGDFVFNGNDLPTILRKISRWYDIEIVYQAPPKKNLIFEGELSRKSDLSAIIAMLEATGDVKFEIKGRRIILIK